MGQKLYWLSEAEWKRIEPLLPRGRRGAHRVDDRRVISGILHMLRSGARWRDCPADYGPYTTIYNRFNRWSRQGVWGNIFYALTGSTGRVGTMSIDATHIKAHRSAAGAKGGLPAGGRPLARRTHHQNPRADRGLWTSDRLRDHAWQLP
ncbi:transposase [Bradyrhizobium vignae]|uniref:Transposase n=1 Tax=Bradyrhizobium vignae TaxID=1549949 RepID=A0A2U3Q9D8_9BRAD|nr:transposase [Bradyrhizobium vignae]SPP98061.1 transposase [Bradyrhizobium vignae]